MSTLVFARANKISINYSTMEKDIDYNQIKGLINNAKDIAIIPSKVSEADAFSAGVGLYHMLSARGKSVSFVYPGSIPEVCKDLMEEEDIEIDTKDRKLMVSIDYSDTPAAKVQYSTEDNILRLVVSPVPKDFDSSRVRAGIVGFDFDVVFVLGAQRLEDLGKTLENIREELGKSTVINIDNTGMNTGFGNVNLVDVTANNLSVLVFKLISRLGLVPDVKSAKALLVGMTYREPKVI